MALRDPRDTCCEFQSDFSRCADGSSETGRFPPAGSKRSPQCAQLAVVVEPPHPIPRRCPRGVPYTWHIAISHRASGVGEQRPCGREVWIRVERYLRGRIQGIDGGVDARVGRDGHVADPRLRWGSRRRSCSCSWVGFDRMFGGVRLGRMRRGKVSTKVCDIPLDAVPKSARAISRVRGMPTIARMVGRPRRPCGWEHQHTTAHSLAGHQHRVQPGRVAMQLTFCGSTHTLSPYYV
jgi:hypothetical protein